MKNQWKNKLSLFLALFFSSDFFYSLTAWLNNYSLKIGYNFSLSPKSFLFSAAADLLALIYILVIYGRKTKAH
jgi:cyanate permease